MVRLRYYNTLGLLYTDWFTLGPNLIVRGVINSDNNKLFIYEFNNEIVFEGQAKNLRQAKSVIKKQLTAAGVNFEGEIRSRQ